MNQSDNEITMPVAVDRHRANILNEAVISTTVLVVALAVGVFLRTWQLNAIGYNTDEAVYTGQAAAIAGVPGLSSLFPIFRAHPLLFQFTLSLLFHFGFQDLWGRLLAVLVGMGTVLMTYFTGKFLYGKTAGALAALFVAFMPYQVIVSRQVLLDGPMALFATVTLYTLARYGHGQRREWLYASGAAMGLTFLSKETGILMLGAIYTFLALARELRLRIIDIIISALILLVVTLTGPGRWISLRPAISDLAALPAAKPRLVILFNYLTAGARHSYAFSRRGRSVVATQTTLLAGEIAFNLDHRPVCIF